MNLYEFIASIIKSVAWPSAVVVGLLLFRSQIKALVASISEFTVTKDGFTGKWGRELNEASRDLAEVKIESSAELPPASRKLLDEQARISNRNTARIAAVWQDLEDTVRRRLERAGVDSSSLGTSALLQEAQERNLITDAQRRSLSGLNAMRNLAVHGRSDDIDEGKAQEFLVLADAMKTVLDITGR